jgi:hypothetical protein
LQANDVIAAAASPPAGVQQIAAAIRDPALHP